MTSSIVSGTSVDGATSTRCGGLRFVRPGRAADVVRPFAAIADLTVALTWAFGGCTGAVARPFRPAPDGIAPGQRPAPVMVLDSHPHKTPGRWAFRASWSWRDSNPPVPSGVRPAHGLSAQRTAHFRVSWSGQQRPGMTCSHALSPPPPPFFRPAGGRIRGAGGAAHRSSRQSGSRCRLGVEVRPQPRGRVYADRRNRPSPRGGPRRGASCEQCRDQATTSSTA
jgi:hypothetical protein